MSEFVQLKNNGKCFERYTSDFCTLINFCGGFADNSYVPLDFHLKLGDQDYYFECKEHHSTQTPHYSFEFICERDKHITEQIEHLAQLYYGGARSFWVIWSENWQSLRINTPFIAFINDEPKRINDSDYRGRNLQKVKRFSFFPFVQMCPRYEEVFKDIPLAKRPFINVTAPNILDYFKDPNYSAWNFILGESETCKGLAADDMGRPVWTFESCFYIPNRYTQQSIIQNTEERNNHEC